MKKCIYKNRLGKTGELIAKDYLIKKGYRVVAENFRYERSEIDLVFCDDEKNLLVFVEVKTRKNKNFGEPEESVNNAKQVTIRKAAEGFLLGNKEFGKHDLRIDVVGVFIGKLGPEINHIENAF